MGLITPQWNPRPGKWAFYFYAQSYQGRDESSALFKGMFFSSRLLHMVGRVKNVFLGYLLFLEEFEIFQAVRMTHVNDDF